MRKTIIENENGKTSPSRKKLKLFEKKKNTVGTTESSITGTGTKPISTREDMVTFSESNVSFLSSKGSVNNNTNNHNLTNTHNNTTNIKIENDKETDKENDKAVRRLHLSLKPNSTTSSINSVLKTDPVQLHKYYHNLNHSIFSKFETQLRKKCSTFYNTSLQEVKKNKKEMKEYLRRTKPYYQKNIKKLTYNSLSYKDQHSDFLFNDNSEVSTLIIKNPPKEINLSEPSDISHNDKEISYHRFRCFSKYIKEKKNADNSWLTKIGIYRYTTLPDALLFKDVGFQSNYINEEIKILLDNLYYLKVSFMNSNDTLYAFKNKDLHYQIQVNKTFEEIIAILYILSKTILGYYYEYTNRFINANMPTMEDLEDKVIKNEAKAMIENFRLLCKMHGYTEACFESYKILVKNVEDILINRNTFKVLKNNLEKCRYLTNKLICTFKNCLKDYYFDKKIIHKYKKVIDDIDQIEDKIEAIGDEKFQRKEKRNKGVDNKLSKTFTNFKNQNFENHMKNQLEFEHNEFTQKITRIKNSLDEIKPMYKRDKSSIPFSEARKIKPKNEICDIGPMKLIQSNLVTSLLKYCNKTNRDKIISCRVIERFNHNKDSQ